jgi:predicted lysophospholipase L1 biosynthesis ABC-type transport system permease subunit
VLTVLLTEYVALGTVAAAAGLILAAVAGALIGTRVLGLPHTLDAGSLVRVWVGVTTRPVVTGVLMSIPALRSPPLPVLREIAE